MSYSEVRILSGSHTVPVRLRSIARVIPTQYTFTISFGILIIVIVAISAVALNSKVT